MKSSDAINYRFLFLILFVIIFAGCKRSGRSEFQTHISITASQWYINDIVINSGSPAEGLLMNVRMVNSVFEDRRPQLSENMPDFNDDVNTESFINVIPEYVSAGVNAFTISLQGGMPGFEGAINTAFNSDGSLREVYLQRVERVIRACDTNGAVVILSCFYQRQHSHESALGGRESIFKATENVVRWISEKEFKNVVLEISNEYRHGGYRNWPDGKWLLSEEGQVELIRFAKQINPELLVSTSAMGNGIFHDTLAKEADFLLIHFNNTSLEDYNEKINDLKKYNKPIVCNEDDKTGREGAIGLAYAVMSGSGWGYMNSAVNQYYPFKFSGVEDDTFVYNMFRDVTTPGFKIDTESLKQTSIIITSPNDGDIFNPGQNITVKLSHLYPDDSQPYIIELYVNNIPIALINNKLPLMLQWKPESSGTFILEAVVKNDDGEERYRSPKVDIIVKTDNY
ncbi:MAG: cellulase family glycosylhydrolase [Prolixibacteraceae bacterium]|nr:cellulase family glycosylhydrolase [Prolixibacteraceae bacterium]